MNLFTGEESDEYFGSDTPPAVRRLLEQAAGAPREQVESLLWTAQATAPDCLSVYYLLYKFHAGRRRFDMAEHAALKGLERAAEQSGLPADWRLAKGPADGGIDFTSVSGNSPERFWIFTLKALAFISVRSGRVEEAKAILAKLAELDPTYSVGSDVTAALVRSAGE